MKYIIYLLTLVLENKSNKNTKTTSNLINALKNNIRTEFLYLFYKLILGTIFVFIFGLSLFHIFKSFSNIMNRFIYGDIIEFITLNLIFFGCILILNHVFLIRTMKQNQIASNKEEPTSRTPLNIDDLTLIFVNGFIEGLESELSKQNSSSDEINPEDIVTQ